MLMWSLKIRRDFGTSWEGELSEGGYIIMDEQASQDIFKSITPLEDGGGMTKSWWWWLLKWGVSTMLLLEANGGDQVDVLGPIAR
jgi:hypothetical protein